MRISSGLCSTPDEARIALKKEKTKFDEGGLLFDWSYIETSRIEIVEHGLHSDHYESIRNNKTTFNSDLANTLYGGE